jgi:hypothetical protein
LGQGFGKTAGYNKHSADGTTLGRLKTVVPKLFNPMLPTLGQSMLFGRIPGLRLLAGATCRITGSDGMIVTLEKHKYLEKTLSQGNSVQHKISRGLAWDRNQT